MYGDDFRVSFDVRRLGTYVISKTDLKAAEANLVEVRLPPADGPQHNQHDRPLRAHLSSAHLDAAVERGSKGEQVFLARSLAKSEAYLIRLLASGLG